MPTTALSSVQLCHAENQRGRTALSETKLSNRLTFWEQLRRNLRLVSIELARPAEAYGTLFRCLPTGPGPFTK
jgi:hypothetical protein